MAQRPVSILVAAAATLVAGCASLNTVDSNVSSYGTWPAGRAPGAYCFERLPSQQAKPEQQAQLELAARSALEQAGFTPAPADAPCSVSVQLGARVTRYDSSPWVDPYWMRAWPYWRYPGWYPYHYPYGWGYGSYYYSYYEREVAILIRDRASGAPLYEARASNDGGYSGSTAVLAAMFEAALKDFPTPAINPRRVTVQLPDKSTY
jgi:hypothetical protein